MLFSRKDETPDIYLRVVTPDDCDILLEWENDPVNRQYAFHPEQIKREDHIKWFERKFADENCLIYIVHETDNLGDRIGAVRYEIEDGAAIVSIVIAPEWRGNGYGLAAQMAADALLFRSCDDIDRIVAEILNHNIPSINMFFKAGYVLKDSNTKFKTLEKRR